MNYLADKFYTPVSQVDMDRIERKYTSIMFDEKVCAKCKEVDNREESFYLCNQCPAYKGTFVFFNRVRIGGADYVGLPRIEATGKKCKDIRIAKHDLNPGLRITRNLFDHQKEAIRLTLPAGAVFDSALGTYVADDADLNGSIEAPPRTGKTLLVLALTVSLGHKTLILAHTKDLLNQFVTDIKDHTNFDEYENVYGIAKNVKDFKKYDIVLATYQSLMYDKQKLKDVVKLFGTIFVDEVHRASATRYAKVVGMFWARNRIGLSATLVRKDGKEFIGGLVIGKRLTQVEANQLTPTVYVHDTEIAVPNQIKHFTYAMRYLERSFERTNLIIDYVEYDLKKGRHILIPVTFVSQVGKLVTMINDRMGYDAAIGFHGKVNREQTLACIREGKVKVTVGIRNIISTGITVKWWSCLYVIAPISNPPNFLQETRRICTAYEGKPTPIIRMFVDKEMDVAKGCARTCYFHTFVKERYTMSPSTRAKFSSLLSENTNALYVPGKSLFSR